MNDAFYMNRCIQLAKNGWYTASPNPMVGAAIVHEGKIISEGWHHSPGNAHAEVMAIDNLTDKSLLKESTIYVSLEPCSHYGKTPPCADRIIKEGIPKVVIGCRDTSAKVNGQGIERLKATGIEVAEGVLEKDCKELNRIFFTNQKEKRPHIHLKWAQTKDGFIDIDRHKGEKGSFWISGAESKIVSHSLRKRYQAILIGFNTAKTDNPALDVRKLKGSNPLRIILDPKNQLPQDLKVFQDDHYLRIVDEHFVQQSWGHCLFLDTSKPFLNTLLHELYNQSIYTLLVEGGARTLQSFIDEKLWDEATIFKGNTFLNTGLKAPSIQGVNYQIQQIGTDEHVNFTRA